MIYKDEVENVARCVKKGIIEMERLGDRYPDGRPVILRDAIRRARRAHGSVLFLRNHTVRRE